MLDARKVLELASEHVSTYLSEGDNLPIIVGVFDPEHVVIGVSLQRNYPLTLIERSFGIPFGRFRSDAVRVLSDPEELHGYKWSIETHEAIFKADAATEEHLRGGRQRRVPIELSTGLGNVLQNLRSVAYVDRTPYMVVGERPDHPPPYACLVEYSKESKRLGEVGVELLLFNEIGGCQQVSKEQYITSPVEATSAAATKFEDQIRWAVSGYPLLLGGIEVSTELTTRNVSDFRHVWRLPKLQKALVRHLASVSRIPEADRRIEFYFGFDEIREKRNFVLATRDEVLTLPLEISMTQEWIELMCNVCRISEVDLTGLDQFDNDRYALRLSSDELRDDFLATDYHLRDRSEDVQERGDFFIDGDRREIHVKLLPAIYPHHIVGISEDRHVVNISICGLSGRSGITIEDAKKLCREAKLTDALIFDNGNDVFARLKGGDNIAHRANSRQTRLTAALHFASLLDPGPGGGFVTVAGEADVRP